MNTALYALISSTYDKAPKSGAMCADSEWHAFQDAVHGFWASASEILAAIGANPGHADFLIAAAVEAQVRGYLKMTREVPAQAGEA